MEYREEPCRSALNRVKGMPFDWSLNPYTGCAHRCTFCYVRAFEARADRPSDDRYGRSIRVKVNVADVLRRELARPSWKRESVAIGAATDPYQPAEGRSGGTLARRRTPEYWREWIGTDPQIVRSTMDATELLGRIAVRFTMPEVKGGRPVLTMDASTGIVLRSEREDLGVLTEWRSFSTEPLERHLFEAPVRH